jgi:hypothetical protein
MKYSSGKSKEYSPVIGLYIFSVVNKTVCISVTWTRVRSKRWMDALDQVRQGVRGIPTRVH